MNATHSATLALLAGAALAAAAADVCYEGRLLDASGAVRAGETVAATLRAYETEDAAEAFAEKSVEIATDADGLFAATASVDPPDGLDSFWIGVAPEGRAEIRPRMRVSPVPFAIVAARAELVSSDGPLALRGASSVDALADGAAVVATNATLQGDAALYGDVTGAGSVFIRDLEAGNPDPRLSMLRTARPDGLSTLWEDFDADATLEVENSSSDPDPKSDTSVLAADDGIAMVMIRATGSDIGMFAWAHVSATLHNGDFSVLSDDTWLQHGLGTVTRLFTFPVRRGRSVTLSLWISTRVDSIFGGSVPHCRGEAKIKMVYFGAD